MKTRRLISNISFNTPDYFDFVIRGLFQNGIIDFAYWICHKGDSDDKKDHIHFCLQPSRSLDTISLNSHFLEFPFHGSRRLPLKPTSKYVPVSSLDDWLLYCKHDKDYLSSKGLSRNYHYLWVDFKSTDSDAFWHDVHNIDTSKICRLSYLRDGVLQNIPFAELIQSGQIPIAYRAQYEAQYRALKIIESSKNLE